MVYWYVCFAYMREQPGVCWLVRFRAVQDIFSSDSHVIQTERSATHWAEDETCHCDMCLAIDGSPAHSPCNDSISAIQAAMLRSGDN